MLIYTKETLKDLVDLEGIWNNYRKKVLTRAVRIKGPFKTITREGPLECSNGYLAIDSDGWPYPIHKDEFEKIYEAA